MTFTVFISMPLSNNSLITWLIFMVMPLEVSTVLYYFIYYHHHYQCGGHAGLQGVQYI